MSQLPRFSVIIPAFNSAACVGRAIESALTQSHAPFEILVVDDGSIDATAEVAESYGQPVRVLRQANGGPAAARNAGAAVAKGDWLAFLDADDAWLPGKLAAQAPLTDGARVGVVHARAGQDVTWDYVISFDTLWRRNQLINSATVVRKSAFTEVGGFDEDRTLISVEDYNLWLRLAAAGWEFRTCPQDWIEYTPAPNSLSQQVERFARAELANAEKLARQLRLSEEKLQTKRLNILDAYGRELLLIGEAQAARVHLATALRLRPSVRRAAWSIASCLPRGLAVAGLRGLQCLAHPRTEGTKR